VKEPERKNPIFEGEEKKGCHLAVGVKALGD